MRIAHLADLHLGYRAYHRLTPGGINQREADVQASFHGVVSGIIERRPDLIVIAGDVFHTVRPTNQAIVHASTEFSRLRSALPDTPVVMVAGNHDAPRSSETGCILHLFAAPGFHVVAGRAERVRLFGGAVSVLAVPDVPGARTDLDTTPDAAAGLNVMLLHGEVAGMLKEGQPSHGPELSHDELRLPEWDYVALGHYHVHRQVADRAWYAGSIDYTSSNIWGEVAEQAADGVPGKGWCLYDTETRVQEFVPTPGLRAVVDLPVIDAYGLAPADVDRAIVEAVGSIEGGIDGRIVRQVVGNIERETARALDHRALRAVQKRAAQYQLDFRRPAGMRVSSGAGATGRRASLDEMVATYLATRKLPDDINREVFTALARQYLGTAAENDATLPVTEAA